AFHNLRPAERAKNAGLTLAPCPRIWGHARPFRAKASPMSARPPIVGIPCDHRMVGAHPFHMVGEKYITAVRDGAEALPLLIPVLERPLAIAELLHSVDGFLFTGSPSNVSPRHYRGAGPREGVLLDER